MPPAVGLTLGVGVVAASWPISALAWKVGSLPLLIGMISACILVGPLVAMGFDSVGARLARGEPPSLRRVWGNVRPTASDVAISGLGLLIVGFVWARAASMMVHVFFPVTVEVRWSEVGLFLAVGLLVGSIFCSVIFTASAFSLPRLKDCEVDAITAALSSANVMLRNKGPMAVWAALIVAGVAIGFATVLFELAVTVPLLGHARLSRCRRCLALASTARGAPQQRLRHSDSWPARLPRGPAVRHDQDLPSAARRLVAAA